jgi:hypothetical protein
MLLARRTAGPDDMLGQAIDLLARDPVPAVRHQISVRCLWLWHSDNARSWGLIERFSLCETSTSVVEFFVNYVLLKIPRLHAERTQVLVQAAYRRFRKRPRTDRLRAQCVIFFARRAVWDENPRCRRIIRAMTAAPWGYVPEAIQLAELCRHYIVRDVEPREESARVRCWGLETLGVFSASVLHELRDMANAHGGTAFREWTCELQEKLRTLHRLADAVVHQVYFASGAFVAGNNTRDDDESPPPTGGVLRRFAHESDALLDILCEIEFVAVAYHLLKTLHHILPVAPARMIMLAAKLIRHSSRDAIHLESLATDAVVEMIQECLADHRHLLRDEPDIQHAILDMLDLFAEAGWSKAVQLTYRLDEVFR